MEKINLALGRFTFWLSAVLAVFAILLSLLLFFWQPRIVTSGGMRSAYSAGSLLFVRKAEATALQPGGLVTYQLADGQVLTSRIVSTDPEAEQMLVLGDDNTQFAGTVIGYGQVLGRGGWALPWLGWLAACLHTWAGVVAGVAFGLLLAGWLLLPHWLKKADEKDGSGNTFATVIAQKEEGAYV